MRLVAMCTNENDLVLDPFCGSGTTGVASLTLGRNFIGIDLDPEHVALSARRMREVHEANS